MTNHTEPGSSKKKLQHISGKDFFGLLKEDALLLDVRPDYELSRLFDVKEVIYCPYNDLEATLDDLPRDRTLVVADAVGLRSKEAARYLMEKGFSRVYNLAGGIVDWERAGLPVTTDKSRILTGSCMCQMKVRHKKTDDGVGGKRIQ